MVRLVADLQRHVGDAATGEQQLGCALHALLGKPGTPMYAPRRQDPAKVPLGVAEVKGESAQLARFCEAAAYDLEQAVDGLLIQSLGMRSWAHPAGVADETAPVEGPDRRGTRSLLPPFHSR